jgi:putative transposase
MRLLYKFNIGQNENISSLCKISNNLYNQALYIFRETLSNEDKWLSYFELDTIMKNTKNLDGNINYKLLKAQCSQQVLRILDKNIKGYYKSVQDYKKHPNKYKGKSGLPSYRKRGSEFNMYYTNQNCKIKDGKIVLSKELSIDIPQYEKYSDLIKNFKHVRIKPLACGYKIEIIYEVKDAEVSKGRENRNHL